MHEAILRWTITIAFALVAMLLGSMLAHADVVCQSYEDPEYSDTFPGYQCPEGFYPI